MRHSVIGYATRPLSIQLGALADEAEHLRHFVSDAAAVGVDGRIGWCSAESFGGRVR